MLSWQPRAFLWHGFLSESECLHIMRLAKPQVLALWPAASRADHEQLPAPASLRLSAHAAAEKLQL